MLGNVRQCVFVRFFAITNLSGRLPLIHTNLANRLLLANTRYTEKDGHKHKQTIGHSGFDK